MHPNDDLEEQINGEVEAVAEDFFGPAPKDPYSYYIARNTAAALGSNPTRAECDGAADLIIEQAEIINRLHGKLAEIAELVRIARGRRH